MNTEDILARLYEQSKDIAAKLDRVENSQIRIEEQLHQQKEQVDFLNLLVWKGGEAPPVTDRVKAIETQGLSTASDIRRLEENLNTKNQMVWGLLTALLSLLAGVFITASRIEKPQPVSGVNSSLFVVSEDI
ncbi:hypothetical protein [Myxosarcina sp. GI1(2024)]